MVEICEAEEAEEAEDMAEWTSTFRRSVIRVES